MVPQMVNCPFGKASMVFPLAASAEAASLVVALAEHEAGGSVSAGDPLLALPDLTVETEGKRCLKAQVTGYTTEKSRAAGASTVRVKVETSSCGDEADRHALLAGAHTICIRKEGGPGGWLPGLAGATGLADGSLGLEVVVLARPDRLFDRVMYLPESVLRSLFPEEDGACVEIRVFRTLEPTMQDCPEQWLRDRLLRLADKMETRYEKERHVVFARLDGDGVQDPRDWLARAGLRPVQDDTAVILDGIGIAPPADADDRVSPGELGYWQEEADLNARCGAGVDPRDGRAWTQRRPSVMDFMGA